MRARHRAALIRSLWTVVCVLTLAHPGEPAHAADDGSSSIKATERDESEDDNLRQRLTEREDKRRPVVPWSIEVAGKPLTVSGEYELSPGYLRRRILGNAVDQPDRFLLEQGLEAEAFYSFGPPISLFAQLRVGMEEDLLSDTFEEVSDSFVERGEMWVYSANIAGSHLSLDLGRLHFEDERRWWWDDELDACRVAYEMETFDIALALARELGPSRSDRDYVDPEHDRVLRLIGEASWDFRSNHSIELFLLHQNDHSPADALGQVVPFERQDESDARLTWLGARLFGSFDLRLRGILGYSLDTALVRGEERLAEFEELSPQRSVVDGIIHQDVSGWGLDAGLTWILPMAWEPRLYAGYAFGSGDATPEAGTDRSFRQTGLQANEAGFGGVQRFTHYGILLAPELSNLGILTLGGGLSLLRSSSLDLVYHHYRLVERATSLRDTRLEFTLTGEDRDLGNEIDVVLALEEWERLELELSVAAFRAGRAFGEERGNWSYGGFFAVRIAF
ncbi:MAG: alginate export family protein [Gammaproteobacteria bacterium]